MSSDTYKLPDSVQPAFLIHPGEHLQDEIDAREMKQKRLAELTDIKPNVINEIIHGKRNVTPYIALKLESVLEVSATSWLNLQMIYDLNQARIKYQPEIEAIRERMAG